MKYLEFLNADTGRVLYNAFSKQFDIQDSFATSTISFSLPRTPDDLAGIQDGAHLKVRIDGQQLEPYFTLIGDSTDYVSDDGTPARAFSGSSIHVELDDPIIPSAWPNPTPASHDFQNATPGTIIRTLTARLQELGYQSNITSATFTGTHDSNGVTWPSMMDRSFTTGDSVLTVIQGLVDQGVVEAKMVGYDLRLYVPGTIGHTLTPDNVVFRVGQNLTEGSTQTDASEFYTDIFAIGDGNAAVMRSRPESYSVLGRRRLRFAQYGGITDVNLLGVMADLELDQYNHIKYEHSYAVATAFYTPFLDYNVGDLVPLDKGDGNLQNIRIKQISVTQDDSTGFFTTGVTLGDLLEDADQKLKRRLDAITGANAGGGAVPSDKTDDKMPPAPPVSISFTTTPYLDDQTRRKVLAIINWPAVTTNADGTVASDIDHYEIQTKVGTATDFGPVSTVPTAQAVVSGFDPSTTLQAKVRTIDTSGLASTWTTSAVYTMVDNTPSTLTTPSQAAVSAKYQNLTITWDGKDSAAKFPTLDCVGVEVHVASGSATFTPTSATRIGVIPYITSGVGGTTVVTNLAPTTTYYVRLIALGKNGTASAASVAGSATTEALIVDPAVITQINTDVAANKNTITQTNTDLTAAKADLYNPGGTVDLIKTTLTGQILSGDSAVTALASQKGQVVFGSVAPTVLQRTNLATDPAATSSVSSAGKLYWAANWYGSSGSAGTTTVPKSVSDGPSGTGLTSYIRKTWTAVVGGPGDTGFGNSMGGTSGFPVTPSTTYTFSGYLRTNASGKVMYIRYIWADSSGANISVNKSTAVTLTPNTWSRLSVTATAPANAAFLCLWVGEPDTTCTSWVAGNTLDGTGLLVEQSSTLSDYFDGSTQGNPAFIYTWSGSANASSSAQYSAVTMWIDTTGGSNTPKRWNGTAWVAATDKAATDAAAAAASAQSSATAAASAANSKGRTYVQDAAPVGISRTNYAINPAYRATSGTVAARTNLHPNPSFGSTTTTNWWLYAGAGGAATLSYQSGSDTPRSAVGYGRATWTTASTGIGGAYVATQGLPTIAGNTTYTASLFVRPSVTTSIRVAGQFSSTGTNTGSFTGATIACPANQWTRISATGTSDAADNGLSLTFYTTGAIPVGTTIDYDDLLVEATDTLQPYFDGSSKLNLCPTPSSSNANNGAVNPIFVDTLSHTGTLGSRRSEVISGNNILSTYGNGGTGSGATIPATPGVTYTFSAWFRVQCSAETFAQVSLWFKKSDSTTATTYSTKVIIPAGSTGWYQAVVTATSPDLATFVYAGATVARTVGSAVVGDLAWVTDNLLEAGTATPGPFYQGQGLTPAWSGTANSSSSVLNGAATTTSPAGVYAPTNEAGWATGNNSYGLLLKSTYASTAIALYNQGTYTAAAPGDLWATRYEMRLVPNTTSSSVSVSCTSYAYSTGAISPVASTPYTLTTDGAWVTVDLSPQTVAPAATTSIRNLIYWVGGKAPGGAIIEIRNVVVEKVSALGVSAGTYFDGSTTSDTTYLYLWTGSTDLSTSTQSRTTDLWIDTTGGKNTPKRWNGTAWVVVTDKVATDAAAAALAASQESLSRGADLVTNGTGYLGTNRNFSGFNFTSADAPPGTTGSFVTRTRSGIVYSDDLIPVNSAKKYLMSCWARETVSTGQSTFYAGYLCYDISGQMVNSYNYLYTAGTTTTLTADLKPGDTTVTVGSSTGWRTATYYNYLTIWNYVDAVGRVWPKETYSRNYGLINAINGNVLTLTTPWAGALVPAGTSVSNGQSGSTYQYAMAVYATIPTTWTQFVSPQLITGTTDGSKGSATYSFPQGTASIRIMFLINYGNSAPDTVQAFGGISMSEASAAQVTADTAQATATTAQATATTAKDAAATASGIASGKADVLIQSTTPTAAMQKSTTLWIDTTNNTNTPKRWSGSAWVVVTDKAATDAAAAAVTAQNAADAAKAAADAAKAAADAAQATANAAQTRADAAYTSASGKNAISWSTAVAPSSATGTKSGDIWNQYVIRTTAYIQSIHPTWTTAQVTAAADNKMAILASWQSDGTNWKDSALTETYIPQLDIGVGTYGELDGIRLKAKTVQADAILVPGSVTDTVIKDGAITTGKVYAGAITSDKVAANAISADKIDATTLTASNVNAQTIAANLGTFMQIKAQNILSGSITAALNIVGGGSIVAGDPLGVAAGLYGQDGSLRSYKVNADGTQYLSTSLGGTARDQLQILSDANQPPVAAINSTGQITASSVSSTSDISIGGTPLLGGALLNGGDQINRTNYFPSPPDFEDGMIAPTISGSVTAALSTSQKQSGSYSCALTATATAAGAQVNWTTTGTAMGVSEGDSIVFSVSMYIPSTVTQGANYAIKLLGGALTASGNTYPDWTKRNQWQRVYVTATIGTVSGNIYPTLCAPSTSGQIIYFDDAQLEPGTTPTSFFSDHSVDLSGTYSYRYVTGTWFVQEYAPASLGFADNLSWGCVARASFGPLVQGITVSAGGSITPVGQFSTSLRPNRTYQLVLHWRGYSAYSPGAYSNVTTRFYMTNATDPNAEAPDPTTSSLAVGQQSLNFANSGTGADGQLVINFTTSDPSNVGAAVQYKFLLGIYAAGNSFTPDTVNVPAQDNWVATIIDTGRVPWPTPVTAPGAGTQRTYTSVWRANNSRSWNSAGTVYNPTGSTTTQYIRQGNANGSLWFGAFSCGSNAISGETSKTIAQAISSGAVIQKAEVWVECTWFADSGGGQVELRPLGANAVPATMASPATSSNIVKQNFPSTTGLWITVPTSWFSSTNNGCVIATPDWQFPNTNCQFAGSGHPTTSYRPQVRLTYTR